MESFTIKLSNQELMNIYGVDSMEKVQAIKAQQNALMCKCTKDTDAHYVPDGKSKVCHKHHWVCNECDKIVQIG